MQNVSNAGFSAQTCYPDLLSNSTEDHGIAWYCMVSAATLFASVERGVCRAMVYHSQPASYCECGACGLAYSISKVCSQWL